jgi:hypothetical protein
VAFFVHILAVFRTEHLVTLLIKDTLAVIISSEIELLVVRLSFLGFFIIISTPDLEV